MILLSFYEITEIVLGLFFFWIGIYLVSKNPFSALSWIAFGILVSLAIIIGINPFQQNMMGLNSYLVLQKAYYLPLTFGAVIYFHASALISEVKERTRKFLLWAGYSLATIFYILILKSDFVLKKQNIDIANSQLSDSLVAGKIYWLLILFAITFMTFSAIFLFKKGKQGFGKYSLPAFSAIVCSTGALIKGSSYYTNIPYADMYFSTLIALATSCLVYSIVRYHLFSENEKIFDRTFLYRTLGITLIGALYLFGFYVFKFPFKLATFSFSVVLLVIVLTTHSFYDWFITFLNDLTFNISSGLSVVNDEEVSQAIKNYHNPEKLEGNSLLRLRLVSKRIVNKETSIDALRSVVQESVEYFEPKEDIAQRNKQNLKYQILKMLMKQSEEGQILWELGFEEYPVRIMTKETKDRPPRFKVQSPSDYIYISRNAYIGLKREAIHDVAWRISYLEKNVH